MSKRRALLLIVGVCFVVGAFLGMAVVVAVTPDLYEHPTEGPA